MNPIKSNVTLRIPRKKKSTSGALGRIETIFNCYRKAEWGACSKLNDMKLEAAEFGGRRIQELIDCMSLDLTDELTKRRLDNMLISVSQTKVLIDIVDMALERLDDYPDHGELYCKIILNQYIIKHPMSAKQAMDSVNLAHAQFYRRKAEALEMFSYILFDEILPSLRDGWQILEEGVYNMPSSNLQKKR